MFAAVLLANTVTACYRSSFAAGLGESSHNHLPLPRAFCRECANPNPGRKNDSDSPSGHHAYLFPIHPERFFTIYGSEVPGLLRSALVSRDATGRLRAQSNPTLESCLGLLTPLSSWTLHFGKTMLLANNKFSCFAQSTQEVSVFLPSNMSPPSCGVYVFMLFPRSLVNQGKGLIWWRQPGKTWLNASKSWFKAVRVCV